MLDWITIAKECNSSAAHGRKIDFHEDIASYDTLRFIDNWSRYSAGIWPNQRMVKLTLLELSALCERVITLAVDIIYHGRRRFLPHRSIWGLLAWVYALSPGKFRLSSDQFQIQNWHGSHLYSNIPLPIILTRPGGQYGTIV